MAVTQPNFMHQNLKNNAIRWCSRTRIPKPNKFKLSKSSRCHSFISDDKINVRKPPNIKRLIWADFIPGKDSWWNLEEENEVKVSNSITVWYVVGRIWGMVAHDKLVIYIGFASLTFAAVSEISIPNLLASSIFAAQNGEPLLFYRNLKILTFLCFASGICSGLRSACFGIANMVLLRRLRETLYKNLLFQDVSFFDRESVGNLTSRLGADCQKLSHVISNNIHLIVRNFLQGTGALINLLTLSRPLALSACFICTLLCMIFLVYGRYQKKAAKLIQDSTAHANEVKNNLVLTLFSERSIILVH